MLFFSIFTTSFGQIKSFGDRYVGCAPDTFTFFTVGNTHSGQIWNSGNGNTSSLDTPIFLYNTPGTYKVKIGNLEKDITILPGLSFNFTTDSIKTGCFPFKFNLRDISVYPNGIVPTSIKWVYQSGGSSLGTSITDFITNYYLYHCFVKMVVTTNVPSCTGELKKDSFFQILDIPRAQMDLSPDSACHIPVSPAIIDRSKDSLRTTLSYLWKWNLPTSSSSTSSSPPSLTYTTNSLAIITLEVANKFGCKGFDTVRFKVDTPTLSYTVNSRICSRLDGQINVANYNVGKYHYTFIPAKRTNGQDIFTLKPNGGYDLTKSNGMFVGFDGDFPDVNVVRPMTIVKTLKTDPRCKVSLKKDVLICQTFPKFVVLESRTCGFPFRDTIIVMNTKDSYACWDSLKYEVSYFDKYLVRITKDSFNAINPAIFKKSIRDSIFIYGLDSLNKVDSFYRKVRLGMPVKVSFFSASSLLTCEHSSHGGLLKETIFSPHLIHFFPKGCSPSKDSFRVYNSSPGRIVSVKWHFGDGATTVTADSQTTHIYTTGKYKAYAVVTNSFGCTDTTNPVFLERGATVIPDLSISKKSFCINDSTEISINNKDSFDKWTFLTDNHKTLDCPNIPSRTWTGFYNAGKQYVYIIAEKNGCVTKIKDSIFIDGPKFNLNYDFKCSRKDNVKFFLTDTLGIKASTYRWDFGDGTVLNSALDTMWHVYTAANANHWVKVSIQNPSGCQYSDSTEMKVRKVKAIFTDTLFCKQANPGALLNATPYELNPLNSLNADYICDYRYTWLMSSIPKIGQPIKHFQPATYDGKVGVNFPLDTLNLSLIARDINGCADTMQKTVYLSNNHIDFKMIYDSCASVRTIYCFDMSSSPWGISSYYWDVRKVVDGIDTFVVDTAIIKNPSFIVRLSVADSFKVRLKIYDSASCSVKDLTKLFIFVKDTSKLIVPDSVCRYSIPLIFSNENDIINYKYRWRINGILSPDDTTYKLNYQFDNLGLHKITLEKSHRFKGCTTIFNDSTEVKPKPKLRVDNSFDLLQNKCFPAVTTIDFFDTLGIGSLKHKFVHNNSARTVKPTTIALDTGINYIHAVFTTGYGCYDSFVNIDTVYKPNANLVMDKRAICKNDSIHFRLINRKDVDTILWSFGDGNLYSGKDTARYHKYNSTVNYSDTIPVTFIVYAPGKTCPYSRKDTIVVLESKSGHYLYNNSDTAYCLAPVKIVNIAKKADSITWSFGDGNQMQNSQDSFNYNYTKPGRYKIVQYAYRKPIGCPDSSVSSILLYPKPNLTIDLDSVCQGQILNLYFKDTLLNSKVYIDPDTFRKSPYTISPIQTMISNTTNFKITAVSEFGCKDSFISRSVVIKPIIEKSWDTILASGSRVILPVGYNPSWNYKWTPKWKNPSCENCPNPEFQILDSVTYDLTLEDYRKCFKNNYKYVIRLYPDILVKVPRAFTPNGDGNNDILYAKGFGIKKLLSFKIFNRQGQLLFVSNDENHGWDGIYKETPQNSDLYYYTYEAEAFIPGKIIGGEGNFMLLR